MRYFLTNQLPMSDNKPQFSTASTLRRKELSILLPTWNEVCIKTVVALKEQCDEIDGLNYEIIVADDASTNEECILRNRTINTLRYCRLIEKKENTGSGATRNFMVKESRYEWLLFLDCDMKIPAGLIRRYLESEEEAEVINGGICVDNGNKDNKGNLRYLYERSAAPNHTPAMRSQHPYRAFRSTNFLVSKKIMKQHPFYEPLRRFEDNYFGHELKQFGIPVAHIDNPTILELFEENTDYMNKLEVDMQILDAYREQLYPCSKLLRLADRLQANAVTRVIIDCWQKAFGKWERRNLTGPKPKLFLLPIYRLGYLCQWIRQKSK